MTSDRVWVEVQITGDLDRVIRIFKSEKAAHRAHVPLILMNYGDAVVSIRDQIFYRCKGYCELCGDLVTKSSGHMHEQKHRGKGGEISLENSVFVCMKTHKREHKDRELHFTRRKP